MEYLYKNEKDVNVTYFTKIKKIDIDELKDNSLIYLKVKSPLNYGIKYWAFYGKLLKRTNKFFDILQYCDDTTDSWNTEQILLKEKNKIKFTKRWAKKV